MSFRKLFFVLLAGLMTFSLVIVVSLGVIAGEFTPARFIEPVGTFLEKNWAIIALALSEGAALLPGKISGILQATVKIGSLIFKKKNRSFQNYSL